MGKKNSSSHTTSTGGKHSKHSRGSTRGGTRGGRGRNQHSSVVDDKRPDSAVDEDNVEEPDSSESKLITEVFSVYCTYHFVSASDGGEVTIDVPVAMWVSSNASPIIRQV
jgi:hypothetical protein